MNSKLDTSPAALRGLADDAHRAIADACSTGYIRMTVPVDEKRDTDRRIERAVAALRALADEKAAWEYERDALKAQAKVARSYSASGGEGDPRAEGYVLGYNAAVIDIADGYVIGTADEVASPGTARPATPPLRAKP